MRMFSGCGLQHLDVGMFFCVLSRLWGEERQTTRTSRSFQRMKALPLRRGRNRRSLAEAMGEGQGQGLTCRGKLHG